MQGKDLGTSWVTQSSTETTMDAHKNRSITPTPSLTGVRSSSYNDPNRSIAKGSKPQQYPFNNPVRNRNHRNYRGNRDQRTGNKIQSKDNTTEVQGNAANEMSFSTDAVGAKSKKKWNGSDASHLLNFRLERRPAGGGRPLVRQQRWHKTGPIMTKEHYLQANCQFVVNLQHDLIKLYSTDPDKFVEWRDIQQVRMYDDQPASCPICLDEPKAPRMTKCAHVYCLPCILHHLSLAERAWSRCPICNDPVERKDLKRVSIITNPTYQVGDRITFKLMRREHNSHYVRPADVWDKAGPSQVFKLNDDECDIRYSKLLSSRPIDTETGLLEDKKQLTDLLTAGDTDPTESAFIRIAMNSVNLDLEIVQAKIPKSAKKKLSKKQPVKNQPHPALTTDMAIEPSIKEVHAPSLNVSQNSVTVTYLDAFCDEQSPPADDSSPDPLGSKPEQTGSEPVLLAEETFEISAEICVVENIANDPTSNQPPSAVAELVNAGTRQRSSNSACSSVDSHPDSNTEAMASELLLPPTGTQPLPANRNVDITKHGEEYYFYQAEDGQHLYLHSLNTRLLATQYGSMPSAPTTIQGTIVEIDSSNMTKSLRNKLRYLSHLPVYCGFSVIEIAMYPPLVSSKVLENYQEEIDARKKSRARRSRTERLQERKAIEREKRKNGKYPSMMLPLNSEHFPERYVIEGDPFFATPAPTLQEKAEPSDIEGLCSTPHSFASAMKSGANVTVSKWPRKPVAPAVKPEPPVRKPETAAPKDEPNLPTYQQSFQADFDALFDQLEVAAKKNESKGVEAATNKKGKGNRGKKLVLLSTGGRKF